MAFGVVCTRSSSSVSLKFIFMSMLRQSIKNLQIKRARESIMSTTAE